MFKMHFSSKKAFVLAGFLSSVAFLSVPLNSSAADLSLANVPHASDIQPEIAHKATKTTSEKELKSNLNDAELQLKQAESSLKQAIAAHKAGQASADEVSTHIQALNDNISALDNQIKNIESAPKSSAHSKWIKEGKAAKALANKVLNNAQNSQ